MANIQRRRKEAKGNPYNFEIGQDGVLDPVFPSWYLFFMLTRTSHPLAQHFISILRDQKTGPVEFRSACTKLTSILALEATHHLETISTPITTPLEDTQGEYLAYPLVVIPILRAGLGMLAPIVELFPDVSVGYMGLERDHATAVARSYYCKLPPLQNRHVLLIDPMLATGGSAAQALAEITQQSARSITLVCIVASPEGVQHIENVFPEVRIVTAALDRELNDKKYILPGLGDFGDRLYGT